ncbi:hypothetical protein FOMA001_g19093 [Fusarium oxysporum f. sp. matthiolae]|nr:hypothetical protein FOMA001_g19093 [Fusarium oxysporum f. sp. matthiolae]
MDDAKSSGLREDDIAGSAVAEYVLNVTVVRSNRGRMLKKTRVKNAAQATALMGKNL